MRGGYANAVCGIYSACAINPLDVRRTLNPLGSERDRPPHFAGRERELGELSARLEYIRATSDPSGGMVLVDGVQGSGKTQLLAEFVARTKAADANVAHLDLTTADIPTSAKEMVGEIAFALSMSKRKTLQALEGTPKLKGVGALNLKVDVQRPDSPEPSFARLMQCTKEAGWWRGRALIVTVDEVQTIAPPHRKMLRLLHEGRYGCPLMLVCAGLQHARRELSQVVRSADGTPDKNTMSRWALHLTLGALSEEETKEAIVQGALAVGVTGVPDGLTTSLARASLGFPQHIHGYLRGVSEAWSKHHSLASATAQSAAAAFGDALRFDYYEGRLHSAGASKAAMARLAEAMREQPDGTLAPNEAAAILDALPADPLAVSATPEAALRNAYEAGVLMLNQAGRLTFGIPSFSDYLIATR